MFPGEFAEPENNSEEQKKKNKKKKAVIPSNGEYITFVY
jgi:hypothetical protein